MLKLTSRFVLELLPYLLSAVVAAVLVPGFVYSLITVTLPRAFDSKSHDVEAMVTPNAFAGGENALELIRQDHDAFALNQMSSHWLAKATKANLVNR